MGRKKCSANARGSKIAAGIRNSTSAFVAVKKSKKKRRGATSYSANAEKENSVVATRKAFAGGMKVVKILEACQTASGQVYFLVQWKGTTEANWVRREDANEKCPGAVIKFYEGLIDFIDVDEDKQHNNESH